MTEHRRRVILSKEHRSLPEGKELVALLTDFSADGVITREEMTRLCEWLEVDRGIDFPACAFLYEIVEPLKDQSEISEDALDRVAMAIERVLPPDIREGAAAKRREHRIARRREISARRQAARAEERHARMQARERAKPLHRGDFVVMGARRSEERRDGCAALQVGEAVILEREPDNRHDANAILVLADNNCELGYVPRELAATMAPLIDAGAQIEASVKKLIETEDGGAIPVVISVLRRGGAFESASQLQLQAPVIGRPTINRPTRSTGCSFVSAAVLCLVLLTIFAASHCGR